jgi:hypothetical protein
VDSRQPDSGDGGDVGRDPDAIQREIEQTRAELADTIDAIADRISPKRAASRGAQAVKHQVSSVFSGSSNGNAPAAVLDADPRAADPAATGARHQAVREIAGSGGGAAYTGTSSYSVKRSLRVDRVLLAVGAVAAVAGVVIVWRSRD